jgi:tRNA dimethylallyltransferase
MGATATGKTALALALAERVGGEIVSMDSRQVYRGLDIGTGKPTPEERARSPHHLVDILDPREPTSAGTHARLAEGAVKDIAARGRAPLLVGGTGLYFRALLEGIVDVAIPAETLADIRAELSPRPTEALYAQLRAADPARAAALSPGDRVRISRALELIAWTGERASDLYERPRRTAPLSAIKFVLTMPRARLRETIAARTRAMFAAGWPEEVRALLAAGVPPEAPGMRSLGYAEIAAAIAAGGPAAEVEDAVITRTRQYAKRQETFFRAERDVQWVDVTQPGARSAAIAAAGAFLGGSIGT